MYLFFETGPCYIAQDDLTFTILFLGLQSDGMQACALTLQLLLPGRDNGGERHLYWMCLRMRDWIQLLWLLCFQDGKSQDCGAPQIPHL